MGLTIEPAMYYDVTVQDDNEACENFGKTFEVNPCYSNGGSFNIECGLCKQSMTIVDAVLLDPQPAVS